jgi:parallel beta-helix repeat protein
MRLIGIWLIPSVLFVLLVPALALARDPSVPEDYPTIQAAIDATRAEGISVEAGIYNENIDFKGKAIMVRARSRRVDGVMTSVIIRGVGDGPVVTFNSGEGPESQLIGFTITGGNATTGGGVYCNGTAPTLARNIITGNSAINGAGIACVNASPTLINNIIRDNTASDSGGGIYCDASSCPTLTGNLIHSNTAAESGGGLYCSTGSSPAVTNNTIAGNSAASGGGLYCEGNSSPTVTNTILAFNLAGGGLVCGDATSAPVVTYCDLFGNSGGDYVNIADQTGLNGNLCVDPLFGDAANGNYYLRSVAGHWTDIGIVGDMVTSPCIDAGDPASRYFDEMQYNGGRINMGFEGNTELASGTPRANPVPRKSAWGPRGIGIGTIANISITFNMPMSRLTVQDKLLINGVKATDLGGVFTWTGRKMTFNPTDDLQPDTVYEITLLEGSRSRAGVRTNWRHFWTFTTRLADPAPAMAVSVAAAPTAVGAQVAVNLASAADVSLSIRNLAGREVAVLAPGTLAAGLHSLLWDGKSRTGTKAPAGVYLVEVMARGKDGGCAKAMTTLRR